MSILRTTWTPKVLGALVAMSVAAQTVEDDSWNRVLKLERAAFALLAQESLATGLQLERLRGERAASFIAVAESLNAYSARFIKDSKTVSAVNALFRMGYYMEFASLDSQALVYYKNSARHPKLTDQLAVFGDPPRPLGPLVSDRIAAVERRLAQRGSSGGASVHSLYVIARYSGKGGIGTPGATPPPEPLTDEEALTVAQRLTFPSDLDRARQDWRKLLDQDSRLLPVHEDSSISGILVFGIKGSAASTNVVATTLDSYRKELKGRYFDANRPAPTMVVFANFTELERPASRQESAVSSSGRGQENPAARNPAQQSPRQQSPVQQSTAQRGPAEQRIATTGPEEIARALSLKLHLRNMNDREGYFEPLDHTLVLRKNLVGQDGKFYLGTGLHELVHALMHVDYPQAPPWLDEGLAALHEEYGSDGPLDNYRLYVATYAAQADRLPSLTQLLNARPIWWGSEPQPIMAAASRYFCMFLLKEGWLPKVYKALRDASPNEPVTETLQRATGKSIQQLENSWKDDLRGRDLGKVDSRWEYLRASVRTYVANLPPLNSFQ